jgi:hypothetical protein
MTEYQLPRDGSVLIIDDKVEEALPLIQLLSQKGIASTYYSGKNDRELPISPTQKIRLAFVDVELIPSASKNTYVQIILRLLDKILPDENGPYIMIVWSMRENVYNDDLEPQIMSQSFNKRPVIFLRLHKADFFESVNDDSIDELLEEAYSSLSKQFTPEDLKAIKDVLGTKLVNTIWKAKNNAIDAISKSLEEKLKDADALYLFTITF